GWHRAHPAALRDVRQPRLGTTRACAPGGERNALQPARGSGRRADPPAGRSTRPCSPSLRDRHPADRLAAVKLAVIGAGSAEFSLKLVRDLCLTPSLAGSVVHLMDVDRGRLAAVQALLERYAREVGADLRVHGTT